METTTIIVENKTGFEKEVEVGYTPGCIDMEDGYVAYSCGHELECVYASDGTDVTKRLSDEYFERLNLILQKKGMEIEVNQCGSSYLR